MVNFSKLSVQICRSTEIYYLFADIYFANLMIISKFASDKENNNIKKKYDYGKQIFRHTDREEPCSCFCR